MSLLSPLETASLAILLLLAASLAPALLKKKQRFLSNTVFAACSLASALAGFAGVWAVAEGGAEGMIVMMGLPDLPFHLRLDPLSGFFVTLVAGLGLFVSVYSIGYVKGFLGKREITSLAVFYPLFLAGMLLVVLANDAYFFMIAWEMMAVSSYFLVVFEDECAANRKAGFIYLLMAHVSAIMILLAFGLMAGFSTGLGSFSGYLFDSMRSSTVPGGWAAFVFLLAFLGFAMKAGAVPLHIWLPEAHPAAPSSVSALMSGAMLKVAVYGIIRVTFDLLHATDWRWGGLVLVAGLASAVMGVLYAMMESDIKRLLAYSSVENIGVILIGVGLSIIFASFEMRLLSALALTAALYHSISHAAFKGLLFMGAGSVIHATHEKDMDALGGLIHTLKWTAPLFLIGCISASSLPPFSGFVSEWLTFQTFLLSPGLPSTALNFLIPLGAALLALTGVLAAATFVKVYGVVFLGRFRGAHAPNVREAGPAMKAGMLLAALASLLLGVLPTFFIDWFGSVPGSIVGANIAVTAGEYGWLWLTPVSAERASYSAPVVFLGILGVFASVYVFFHARKGEIRRAPIWDCGFGKMTGRMQYNGASFAMPFRRIFGFLFSIKEFSRPVDRAERFSRPLRFTYSLKVRDRAWVLFYKPFSEAAFWAARKAGRIQHGRIQVYLLYSFATLILLLVFA